MISQSYVIASGKGGVGKTTIAACLAIGLAMRGEQVAIVDTDIGLRDMDAMLGIENSVVYDICNVINKDCRLPDAMIQHPLWPNLSLLPAAQFNRVKDIDKEDISKIINKLKTRFLYVIIDCPAGIERGLINSTECADHVIIVTTPDDISIRNAEKTLRFYMQRTKLKPMLIVNQLVPSLIKKGVMYSADAIAGILDIDLIGAVPKDELLYQTVLTRVPPMLSKGSAHEALLRITDRLRGHNIPIPPMGIIQKKLLLHFIPIGRHLYV